MLSFLFRFRIECKDLFNFLSCQVKILNDKNEITAEHLSARLLVTLIKSFTGLTLGAFTVITLQSRNLRTK
jgi:hypothetical protein